MRRALLWFKQDLRLDDHPALWAGMEADELIPVFILDPKWVRSGPLGARRLGVHRARFLLESITALDNSLRALGSRLLLLPGHPEDVIPDLVQRLDIQEVLTLEEIAPEELTQLAEVRSRLGHVRLREFQGNSLFRMDELLKGLEQMPQVYSEFCRVVEQRLPVFQPRPVPRSLPVFPQAAQDMLLPMPTLSQLGLGEPLSVPNSAFPFAGGEPAAQSRLRDYLWERQGVRNYIENRHGLIGTEYSSKLSPWLANGSLSPRRVAAELRRHESRYGRNESTHCLWQKLLWREFFRLTLERHGQALFEPGGVKATARAPDKIDERFQQWCQGRTGMPIVDANMRELADTGFMSYCGRQIVASYLVHDLKQDWRHGAAWFEEHQLDYDPASSWGNWAYVAGYASDPKRSDTFNALRKARDLDPEGTYVSLWLPELRVVSPQLRHTPFLLPLLQLEMIDYPRLSKVPESWTDYLPNAEEQFYGVPNEDKESLQAS